MKVREWDGGSGGGGDNSGRYRREASVNGAE